MKQFPLSKRGQLNQAEGPLPSTPTTNAQIIPTHSPGLQPASSALNRRWAWGQRMGATPTRGKDAECMKNATLGPGVGGQGGGVVTDATYFNFWSKNINKRASFPVVSAWC